MPRIIELKQGTLTLKEDNVKGFLERTVNSIGTSAKVDVPRRFIGKRAYVIIIDEFYGIFIKGITGKKNEVIPLSDFECNTTDQSNYQLVDDYKTWFWNNR